MGTIKQELSDYGISINTDPLALCSWSLFYPCNVFSQSLFDNMDHPMCFRLSLGMYPMCFRLFLGMSDKPCFTVYVNLFIDEMLKNWYTSINMSRAERIIKRIQIIYIWWCFTSILRYKSSLVCYQIIWFMCLSVITPLLLYGKVKLDLNSYYIFLG